ncbi:diadenosine tetraphosphate (Ap4A) HIT family hydrolase [Thermocatellispora tengchongensis]|uniref:Diadenosine tetraphosphate (Ap4A) HIT family hydrolase n=1 Tax=Thermocatellispora tengchongensis TaxID=1073253 RepID=A0A840P0Y7_9ACTN|nr:HIT family protein [Thermocatellispora tengchongensis]MBB5132639.1 diadenosine tetraphosphate (Ap4A) HIT family hydrolase [Thermocatellispora tengchongensis]
MVFMVEGAAECPFCALVSDGRSPVWAHLFPGTEHDEVILASESFLAVLDTAPLAEGHVLIVSKAHLTSLAALPESEREELALMRRAVQDRLRAEYGPFTYFEHGAASFARHAGACIDHAHLHLVPGRCDLLPHVARDHPGIESFPEYEQALDHFAGRAYLIFARDFDPVFGVDAPACATQYLRRVMTRAGGSKQLWNWRDCVRWADALSIRDQLIRAAGRLRR